MNGIIDWDKPDYQDTYDETQEASMMTLDNTEGYTQEELDVLNAEFERRYADGDWEGASRESAEQWFSDEVAGR